MSPSSSSQLLPWSGGNVRANDRVFIPGTRHYQSLDRYRKSLRDKNYEVLGTVTLTKSMSVAELAILLRVVNEHSIHYDLLKYQCYWYAYTVWEVMRTHFGGVVVDNALISKRGKYMGITIRREDSVGAITRSFKSAWKELCEEETRLKEQDEERLRQVNFRAAGYIYC
jgi:hypothetical protein